MHLSTLGLVLILVLLLVVLVAGSGAAGRAYGPHRRGGPSSPYPRHDPDDLDDDLVEDTDPDDVADDFSPSRSDD